MTINHTNEWSPRKPLRLLPGAIIAIVMVVVQYVLPVVAPDVMIGEFPLGLIAILGGLVCSLAIVVWWLFFSRVKWAERLGALVVMIVAVVVTKPVVHASIAGGAQGNLLYVLAVPTLGLALVVAAVAGSRLSAGSRRAVMAVIIMLGAGVWTLARTEGVGGGGLADLEWRWTPTAEERLLAQGADDPKPLPPAAVAAAPAPAGDTPAVHPPASSAAETSKEAPVTTAGAAAAARPSTTASDPSAPATRPDSPAGSARDVRRAEWPGFRGPARDGVVRGVQINTDWAASPPVELWRRPLGPGWSSFAVDGDLLYTQEQRGDDEMVACYRVSTGEPVWRHRDATRFYESNGGPGPRGTPTVHNGRVYAMGATGILNALDAGNGARLWSRNTVADTGVELPGWGIASSPLVVDDGVIVAVSGRLAAYDMATGNQRWLGPKGGAGYSSPHLFTIDGVPQVMLLRGSRTISVAPADGTLFWEHVWLPGASIVQPAVISDGEILITVADAMGGLGARRLALTREAAGWKVVERWTSRGLKPYFSDSVVHEGHAYGFDGSILAAIDLNDGQRKWKGGRYGNGQLVLLADQDLLLVMSEDGELALVSATPDKFTELARIPALDSKTWNHPVLVRDILLVRNGEEMAAFRLSLASHSKKDTIGEKP